MRHAWSMLCQKGLVDRKSNSISLIEVIEELHVSSVKGKKSTVSSHVGDICMDWVTLWERSDLLKGEKSLVKDIIILPSGKGPQEREHVVDLLEVQKSRTIRRLEITLPEQGKYLFRTMIKRDTRKRWETVSEIPLEVIFD